MNFLVGEEGGRENCFVYPLYLFWLHLVVRGNLLRKSGTTCLLYFTINYSIICYSISLYTISLYTIRFCTILFHTTLFHSYTCVGLFSGDSFLRRGMTGGSNATRMLW